MTEKGKLEWADAGGNELAAGAKVAMVGTVVGRHGGGRVSVECAPGQRIILPGTAVDQSKGAGKQALKEAQALVGALEKGLDACGKEKESFKTQLARVQAEFDAYIAGPKGGSKGG